MYSFDGQYKFGLKQSLGGASKKVTKSTLIESAKQERLAREKNRRHNFAAIKLQSFFRGLFCRSAMRQMHISEFDNIRKSYPISMSEVDSITKVLCLFCRLPDDYERLVFLSQVLLKYVSSKNLKSIFEENPACWTHRIKKLLNLSCRSFQLEDVNISIPLRMLEVFTATKTYMFNPSASHISSSITMYLVSQGYFSSLRTLLNKRVPASVEPSPHPPTSFAAAAKELVLTPLRNSGTKEVYGRFAEEILSAEMSEQICYFLVPALSAEISLHSLMNAVKTFPSSSVWLLYSLLVFVDDDHKGVMKSEEAIMLLASVVKNLIVGLQRETRHSSRVSVTRYESDTDDSDDEMQMNENSSHQVHNNPCLEYAREKCIDVLNNRNLVNSFISVYSNRLVGSGEFNQNICESIGEFTQNLCQICFHLLAVHRFAIRRHRLMYSLAFNHFFLRDCWRCLYSMSTRTNTGKEVKLLHQLSYGRMLSHEEKMKLIPSLGVFSSLFRYSLFSVYDSDFYDASAGTPVSVMPFKLSEIVEMSSILKDVVIGLVIVMHPDVKPTQQLDIAELGCSWQHLCQIVTQLVKHLYERDCRHSYCPKGHWLSSKAAISQENLDVFSFLQPSDDDITTSDDVIQPRISTLDSRGLSILKYIPFAIPFLQRVRIFQRILLEDKKMNQGEIRGVYQPQNLSISVNRKYLYQDAYDQLAKDRAYSVKQAIRVQMINAQGLDEAGIDGGGVFREFMTQLMRMGFDPSYGFFKTTSQQLLYPNPDVGLIQPDFLKHFHFLGRMLGKVIYESMMVELPLADFFLCKLLNRHHADVDIYHLESLDPELYRNLFNLKSYEGNIEDLALNFTVVNNDLGETSIEELKEGGKDIAVTNKNKIEYIHLMADYRLNKQIRSHCNAFRAGLSDVINIEWLQMFDHRELQILISGAQVAIDINDLRANTNYSGSDIYVDENPYIEAFWEILAELNDSQKRQFLKFVTSCSRPPLLGFSELYPKFCIHYGGEEDRLPTASTCMNLLKLPHYESTELLKSRLVYAIESESGFELS